MERDQALKFMHDLLRLMTQKNGSDLFITANFPPAIKVDGKVTPVSNQILSAGHTAELARAIMNDRQAAEFESTKECNFAISPSGIGRFRVNALIQQGRVAVILRTINMSIPTLEQLGMPQALKNMLPKIQTKSTATQNPIFRPRKRRMRRAFKTCNDLYRIG